MAWAALRHPFRSAEREAAHLKDVADEGRSAATPAILIGTWVVVAGVLVASAVGVALLAAYLLTR